MAFAFERKLERTEARRARRGAFRLAGCLRARRAGPRAVLQSLELLADEVIEAALFEEPAAQHACYPRYLHLVVSECRALGSAFELERLDVVRSEQLFIAPTYGAPPSPECAHCSSPSCNTGRVAAPSYDLSQWPLLRVMMPLEGTTDSEFEVHLRFLEQKVQAGQRFALLVDARNASPPSPRSRQALGQMWRRAFQRDPHVVVGIGVVLSSAIERGVLTAILWAAGRMYPQRTFAGPVEATAWLQKMLDTTDLPAAGGARR